MYFQQLQLSGISLTQKGNEHWRV